MFFVQYGNFKDINDYKNGDISYNHHSSIDIFRNNLAH
ncbi:Csa1 family protein [Staphylococcus aureus]